MDFEEFVSLMGNLVLPDDVYANSYGNFFERGDIPREINRKIRSISRNIKYMHTYGLQGEEYLYNRYSSDCSKELSEVVSYLEKAYPADQLDNLDDEYKAVIQQIKKANESFVNNAGVAFEALRRQPKIYYNENVYFPDEKFSEYEKFSPVDGDIFPTGEPKLEDVKQVKNGSCYLLAPLATIANKYPDMIKKIIKENPDNKTVVVNLNGLYEYQARENIKFPCNIVVDKTVSDIDSDSAPWVRLIEKAMSASRLLSDMDKASISHVNPNKGYINMNSNYVMGGSMENVIELLTSRETSENLVRIEHQIENSATVQEGFKKLKDTILEAKNKNAIFTMGNFGHAIAIADIEEKDDDLIIKYYDQFYDKCVKSMSLHDMYYKDKYVDSEGKKGHTRGDNVTKAYDISFILCSTVENGQITGTQRMNLDGIPAFIDELETANEKLNNAKNEDEKKTQQDNIQKHNDRIKAFLEDDAKRLKKEEDSLARREEVRKKVKEYGEKKAAEDVDIKAKEIADVQSSRESVKEAERKAEEQKRLEELKRQEEAKRNAEEEAKRNAEEEAKRKAEEEAKRKAEEEVRLKAEKEAKILEEETDDLEPKSMSIEEYKNYLKEAYKLFKSDEFRVIERLVTDIQFSKYDDEFYEKNKEFSFVKNLAIGGAIQLVAEATSIISALDEDPKVILDKKKFGNDNEFLCLKKLEKIKGLIGELKERNFPIPENYDKESINLLFDKYVNWLEKFEKNTELTSISVWDKVTNPETETEGKFGDIIKELKAAKTRYNSSQYTDIIDMLEAINGPDPKRDDFPLDTNQLYVVKLLSVKKLINKYIDHKLDSGVKQNVFKKLAAVEKLNQDISERLKYIKITPFEYGVRGKKLVKLPSDDPKVKKRTVNLSEVNLTYNAEVNAAKERIKQNDSRIKTPELVNDYTVKKQYVNIKDSYPEAKMEDMKNTYNCMSRIILSAMKHGKSYEDVKGFKEQQKKFWNHPINKIPKENERAKHSEEPRMIF